MSPVRLAWFVFGMTCVGLGAVGVVLPLLPTTPFLLLAAYAFARSSERWHRWLMEHKLFGPMINDWNRYGAIDRQTKIVSIISMIGLIGLSVMLGASRTVIVVQAVVLTASATFIVTRPHPPDET